LFTSDIHRPKVVARGVVEALILAMERQRMSFARGAVEAIVLAVEHRRMTFARSVF
jgi:hypothetical protein